MTRRLLILVVLAALAAACTLTWTITWRRGVAELQRNAAVRVDRTTNALKSTLDRYESLPYLLGSHPYVQDLLAEPTRADYTGRVNRYLEDLNEHAHATVTCVIGADGLCVAASNWRAPDSFVGTEYRFRPYFLDAMNGQVLRDRHDLARSRLLHLAAVWRDGKIAGVVVVKLNLEWFQAPMRRSLLVRGRSRRRVPVVGARMWYHNAAPAHGLSPRRSTTRQYAQQPVTPLCCASSRCSAPMRKSCAGLACGARFLAQAPDRRADWLLVTLAPIAPVDADARNATIVTGFGFVSVALLAFYWRMRARACVK